MQRFALVLILGLGLTWAAATPASAFVFVVDDAGDEPDAVLDGACETAGPDPVCTLRAAVQEANDTSAADTVELPALEAPYDLTLNGSGEDAAASGDLDLVRPLTILGTGQPVIDGLGDDRVFDIGPSGTPAVTIAGVEVRGGGGVQAGAGIRVEAGTLSLRTSTVADNTAESGGATAAGGGVWIGAGGTHSITSSAIAANTAEGATGAQGGGVAIEAPPASVAMTNSTVSGNEASTASGPARGGGIASDASLSLLHVTVHENTAAGPSALGGSIGVLGGITSLRASIVSAGVADPGGQNCIELGGSFSTLGSNVEAPTVLAANQCGLGTQDRFSGNADLAPLADRGGPTQTHALFTTSVALDAVPSCFPVTTDQRGEPRPSGVACEAGSFERQVQAPPGTNCFGAVPTILGTGAPERIVGTPGADVIIGQGGKDLIKGRGGADRICAGKEPDRVYGGGGRDRIAGEDGGDRLFGQAGRDILNGNAGRDLLSGGKGRDRLKGGGGRDRCKGGRRC